MLLNQTYRDMLPFAYPEDAGAAFTMSTTPTPADKFTFGLWTIGYNGTDPFGGPTRKPLDVVHAVEKLAELGAYGLTFHDDDLFAFGSTDAERQKEIDRLKGALAGHRPRRSRWSPPTCSAPRSSRTAASPPTTAPCAASPCARCCATSTSAAELGAKTFVMWGGREGAEYDAAKDIRQALERYREAVNLLGDYVTDKGYDIRFAIEPKPNEPRGDILLPTRRPRARVHRQPRAPRDGRPQPRGRPRADGRA